MEVVYVIATTQAPRKFEIASQRALAMTSAVKT